MGSGARARSTPDAWLGKSLPERFDYALDGPGRTIFVSRKVLEQASLKFGLPVWPVV